MLPNSVVTIKQYAFQNTDAIIIIPDSVKIIENGALRRCSVYTQYASANDIPSTWHYNWHTDATFVVYDIIEAYEDSQGIVYGIRSNGSISVIGYKGKINASSIVIPEGVDTIEGNSFRNVTFQSLLLPKSLTTIKSYAFYNFSIQKLYIPQNVKKIEANAFVSVNDGTIYVEADDIPAGWDPNWTDYIFVVLGSNA